MGKIRMIPLIKNENNLNISEVPPPGQKLL